MKKNNFRRWSRALAAALLALPTFAQQYHSNDLTPPAVTAGKLHGASKGRQVGGGSNNHAYLFTGNALTAVDLHPAVGYYYSVGTSGDDSEQCGYAYSTLGGIHAMKWSGSNSSAVDLQPSGFNFSYCTGVDGGEQGGFAEQQSYAVTISHGMVWHGTSTPVDLHPVGYTFSRVMGLKSGEQVGYGSSLAYPYGDYVTGYHTTSKALVWHGSAASAVSLHPLGYDASEALATNGTTQGGWGYRLTDGHPHAMLWNGTAESAVDLHPAGYTTSRITGIFGDKQVGEGWIGVPGALGSVRHALLWSGSAASVVDLNQYLPTGYTHGSATGMDVDGNVVGFAYNTLYQGMYVGGDAIAVVFAPGQAPATQLASITLSATTVAPGGTLNATVALGGAAPAGGVAINFLSTNLAVLGAPAPVTIAEGQTSATVAVPVLGTTLTAATNVKLYASDGSVSRSILVTVKPVVKLNTLSVNPVEGGFNTTGAITLSIPAQVGGATVSLVSSNPALVQVPATVTVPQGYASWSFSVLTGGVTTATSVPVTATFDGITVTANVALSAAPVVSLSALTIPTTLVGGQTLTGTVTLNNFVRDLAGATILLSTGDTASVQLPASVFIPKGGSSVSFTATTGVVPGNKGVTIKAIYNGGQLNSNITLTPIPPISVLSAVYKATTGLLKVDATSVDPTAILTYGSNGVPFGTMQVEAGLYQGSIALPSMPATVTVWSSLGAQVTVPVVDGLATSGGGGGGGSVGGGGGGGGGGSTTGTFKLSVKAIGKGMVTSSPSAIYCGTTTATCAANLNSGTSITLTAKPDAGQPWLGWTGDCSGTSLTCTLSMTKAMSVNANFK